MKKVKQRVKAAQIKKAQAVLSAFHKKDEKQAKNLLPFLTDSAIDTLGECFYNSLYSPLNFSKANRKKLQTLYKPRMKVVKKIAHPSTPVAYKRKQLQKGSGLITALASALIPAIIALVKRWKMS